MTNRIFIDILGRLDFYRVNDESGRLGRRTFGVGHSLDDEARMASN